MKVIHQGIDAVERLVLSRKRLGIGFHVGHVRLSLPEAAVIVFVDDEVGGLAVFEDCNKNAVGNLRELVARASASKAAEGTIVFKGTEKAVITCPLIDMLIMMRIYMHIKGNCRSESISIPKRQCRKFKSRQVHLRRSTSTRACRWRGNRSAFCASHDIAWIALAFAVLFMRDVFRFPFYVRFIEITPIWINAFESSPNENSFRIKNILICVTLL